VSFSGKQKMRGNSQLPPRTSPAESERLIHDSTSEETMNIRLALLLTRDPGFEKTVTEALAEIGAKVLTKHDIDHTLEIGCKRAADFDVVLIDRSDCHAITLLTALHACRHDLPVVVVTSANANHCAALAYANGATACLAKPISAADLKLAFHELGEPNLKLAAAPCP
jgi:ActR/RegA family two-component response regulator